ncbi:MAG: LacI family DNA-binding transcriptional regulator [Bacteroidales bacterium]
MKRVSLADLSSELHVSKTLISLVLNNKGDQHGISKATQAKVIAKAAEMNYFPNQMARGLRIGKSGTIGLIVADIANPFYAVIARYIEDEVNKLGYNLIICSSDEKDEKEYRLLRMLRDRQVDGLIVSSTLRKPNALMELKRLGYPIVLIDRDMPKLGVPTVLVNNHKGAYELTRHLISQGHKRIAHVSLSPNYLSTIRDRVKGYRDAMKDSGIRISSRWVINVPFDDVPEAIERVLPEVIKQPGGATAIFTANNNLAVAVLGTLRNHGFRIPEDIALCSFDDVDLFRFSHPPITACEQPSREIAAESVRLLSKLIEQKASSEGIESVLLNTTLNLRSSTTNGSPKI